MPIGAAAARIPVHHHVDDSIFGVDQYQNITSVCEGTGKKNNYDYYMQRKRITGDFQGQAPALWAASALLR
jgi:hypothetical protein